MREVSVSGGLIALVDDDDFDLVCQYRWFAARRKNVVYAERQWQVAGRRRAQLMHNLIMGLVGIDHRNRNGLDNRRTNLRAASQSQNGGNQPGRRGTSQYKGVFWSTCRAKWIAQIKYGRRSRHLGLFVSETDAACAYDAAACELFGDFAYTNFLPKDIRPAVTT